MGPLFVLSLASQQAQWLGLRQQTIAGNVANANTPGFRAADVQPFADVMERTGSPLSTTDARHIGQTPGEMSASRLRASDGWETSLSGNSVSLEKEMMKAGEVHRSFALNTGIVKALNRMIASSVKG